MSVVRNLSRFLGSGSRIAICRLTGIVDKASAIGKSTLLSFGGRKFRTRDVFSLGTNPPAAAEAGGVCGIGVDGKFWTFWGEDTIAGADCPIGVEEFWPESGEVDIVKAAEVE